MTDFQSPVWALDLHQVIKTGVNVLVSLAEVRISLSLQGSTHTQGCEPNVTIEMYFLTC